MTKQKMVIILAILLIAAIALTFFLESRYDIFFDDPGSAKNELSYGGKDYVLKKGLKTVLLLGLDELDRANDSTGNNLFADSILLLVIDEKKETCRIIRIDPGTVAQVNVLGFAGNKIGTETKPIALAHTYGNGKEVSCRNVANAVSDLLLGVDVDHFVSWRSDAIAAYTDLVGGVTLELLEDFIDASDGFKKGDTVTLTGEQAVKYIAAREDEEGEQDSSRAERQRQFMERLLDSTRGMAAQDGQFVARAAVSLAEYLVTDCSSFRLKSIFRQMAQFAPEFATEIDGERVNGAEHVEFYPSEDSLTRVVIECFYEEKPAD